MSGRLAMLPFIALATQKSNFSPNPPPPPEETVKFETNTTTRDTIKGGVSWIPQSIAVVSHIITLCEGYVLLCEWFPTIFKIHPLWELLVPYGNSSQIRITPGFILSWIICCGGSAIRVLCFHYLGRQFTFQLAVRKEHKLITGGPYAWVRHPAYGGAVLQIPGLLLCYFLPGSWWYECGLGKTLGGKLILFVMLGLVAALVILIAPRIKKEDLVLKEQFGSQWERWAKQTPYLIIPYVY
ncbi:hypothetical protein QCA50_014564 [Cerrena zonata]|uniref:Protein-S-isoprenylcysteine O-methyltransferase n=1 Tax=Cerrena zonata TaxID=2478898 RepID=A0AAW0FVR1_9APHY